MEKEYYLCSGTLIKYFPKVEKSKPFKSGYRHNKHQNYYVACLDFRKVQEKYDSLPDDHPDKIYFSCHECVPGQMSVNRLTIAGMKRRGVFVEIENVLQLTTERNRAMTIYELSDKYGITPIELINRICKK